MDIIKVFAEAKDYVHINWLLAGGCTGCSVSFAQTVEPDIIRVLTSIIAGNSGLPITLPDWWYVVHPASGSLGTELIEDWIKHSGPGKKIFILEGVMQQEGFCDFGGRDIREWVKESAEAADHLIAFGSCSAFGGIPHAKGNVTGAMSLQNFLREVDMSDEAERVINLPRCPGHPDSLVQTLVSLIQGVEPELDGYNRPLAFYGRHIHNEQCPYRPFYDRGIFANFGQSVQGCRFRLGCKGPITWADCPTRKWNKGRAFCIDTGICIGCSEPAWPDGEFSPFYVELSSLPTVLSIPAETWGTAFVGAAGATIAIHAIHKALTKKKKEEGKE
ncbi:MAG: NiFe hydrogenase [archaeon]|nr:NiFe hydrogenase [archaeon]MCP8314302.1 NiFe hydrogenase [archaeon]MCP8318190.1 NiFe hydrogenase [archaeon]MCP8319683.1 NiFe hydrogenase [archaeon]